MSDVFVAWLCVIFFGGPLVVAGVQMRTATFVPSYEGQKAKFTASSWVAFGLAVIPVVVAVYLTVTR